MTRTTLLTALVPLSLALAGCPGEAAAPVSADPAVSFDWSPHTLTAERDGFRLELARLRVRPWTPANVGPEWFAEEWTPERLAPPEGKPASYLACDLVVLSEPSERVVSKVKSVALSLGDTALPEAGDSGDRHRSTTGEGRPVNAVLRHWALLERAPTRDGAVTLIVELALSDGSTETLTFGPVELPAHVVARR